MDVFVWTINKILKSYVRNQFYPEDCIVEGYIKEKSTEFYTGFFSKSNRTAGIDKDKNKFSGLGSDVTMKTVAEKVPFYRWFIFM